MVTKASGKRVDISDAMETASEAQDRATRYREHRIRAALKYGVTYDPDHAYNCCPSREYAANEEVGWTTIDEW